MNKNNELMNIENSGFLALQDFDLANVMSEEMDGLYATFERIKIPSGGGIMFEIPGENPDEPETVKEFSAVILYQHSLNAYYKSEYQGGSNPPDCGSYDGHNGEGDPGGNCDSCPLNQYGSGKNGAKACKNRRRLYLLREGEIFPMILSLPTGSLKAFTRYLIRVIPNESWILNREYIKKALKILVIDEEDCDMELAEDEKEEVLEKLGDPPYSCYNLYFITIKNDTEERIVYIGQTNGKKSRFIGGHHAALKLHAPQYSGFQKYVYFGTVTFTSTDNHYLPMECLETTGQIKHLLNDIERILIYAFKPELNTQKYSYNFIRRPRLQIENHTGSSDFLDFYVIDWTI